MRPARWVPRGRVAAVGVVVDPRVVGEARARARVLGWMGPGAQVFRSDAGLVVRWAQARELVEPYPGAPLLPHGSTAPLDPDEQRGAPSLAYVRGGELVPLVLTPEDPVGWLDLDLPIVRGQSLGAPPPPPVEAVAPVSVRAEDLGVRGGLLAERSAIVERIARGGAPTLLERAVRGLASLVGWARGAPPAEGAGSQRPNALQRLESWLARAADQLGLSSLLGARYARFFEDLLERFDRGDLLEALRRAIPLGGGGEGTGSIGLFGSLPMRSQLGLSFGARATGLERSIGTAPSLYEMLRKLYLAAVERLLREGNVEMAAFVHDELLNDPSSADALLEKHDKHALAAKLAESRKLPAGLVVRLWWLAGDHERAVAIARRERAWFDAILRLEQHVGKGTPQAIALRWAWARALADEGRWGAAVDAAKEEPTLRAFAIDCMDRAIAEGGPVGASLVPLRLGWSPEELPRLADVTAQWGEAPDPVALDALVRALGAAATSPEATALTRRAARIAAGRTSIGAPDIANAVRRHRAGPLARDLRPVEERRAVTVHVPAEERGAAPILDAVRAADGSWLVALGEAGLLRLDAHGRVLRHFDWPAVSLVRCGEGNRFVAIGAGGTVRRLARLDLESLRPWTEAELGAWAHDSDGDTWFVAAGEDVFAVDLLAEGWRALWSTRRCGAPVVAVASAVDAAYAVLGGKLREVWWWQRPSWILRERRAVGDLGVPLGITPGGNVALLTAQGLKVGGATHSGEVAATSNTDPVAVLARVDAGLRYGADGIVITLDGARRGGIRSTSEGVWAFDDLGRLVFVDAARRPRILKTSS